MVLSLMRKHAKSWLIKFLIAIIAIVFIFYFGYSFTSQRGLKVASVNGESISGLEYQKAYRNLLEALQREYKNVWSDNLIEAFDLKNRALESLIDQKLLSQEARRIGLDITEKEIQDQIMAYPAFQFKGRFDENRYRSLLYHNRMNAEDFEADIAREMLQNKLNQFLMTFLQVSDQEVLDHYTFSNEKVKISFVQFSPESFREAVKIDDTLMEEYFSDHKEEYRIPEKMKISYIIIDPERYGDKVVVTDQLIEEYYEYNIETFKEEKQVKARHIIFKLKRDATEDEEKEAREKASSVLDKARKGEDFGTLAKAYSEGPSGEKGGDLGYFSKGQMEKTFEEASFKMKQGQISELIRTSFGYHIIKVEDIKEARTKGLEEVREQVSDVLIKNESMDLAREKALSLIDQMPYDVDLVQYAKQHNVPIGHSGYFSQDEPIPDIGGDEKLRKSIFSLQKNDVSEVIELKNKLYVIQVVDKKASYLPEINEVSDQLKKDFTAHLATLKAKSAAEQYLEKLHGGAAWDELAKESNLKPETTDFFTRARQGLIPKIGYAPDLQEAIFSLDEDKRYPDKVFSNDKGAFVARWEEEKGIDEKQYPEEKEKFRNSLMMAKQRIIFKGWLDNLKKEADIDRTPFERYK